MCLGVYGKILNIEGDLATVDFGGGLVKKALIGVEDANEGDYVVVHAGIIVSKLNRSELTAVFNYLEEAARQTVGIESEADEYIRLTRERLRSFLNGPDDNL